VTMAKGLAGGFPLSAVTGRAEVVDAAPVGGIGGTYAGNPLAVAAANAVLDIIEEEQLIAKVKSNSASWHRALKALAKKHSERIAGIRGAGYMVGLSLKTEGLNLQITSAARGKGLLVVPAGHNTIRLLPALTATAEQLSEAVSILDEVFTEQDSQS